jgi:3-phosphoshikimate 1-carboxyvinyltransferase
MSHFIVKPINSLHAELSVPGDKSMSHRAAIIAGLADGDSVIWNFLPSEDCLNTLHAMAATGVAYDVLEELEGYGPTALRIHGRMGKLQAPQKPID